MMMTTVMWAAGCTAGRRTVTVALAAAACASGCGTPEDGDDTVRRDLSTDDQYRALAEYWAPRWYQDTDSSFYKGDYLTRFEFDGDYNGKNNWESLDSYSTVPAYIYYAVSETVTHYFLGYYVFHPRDWHEILTFDRHENDFEGIVVAVAKSGGMGSLVALETLAHDQIYQYAHAPGITSGSDNVDGAVRLYGGSHPEIFIEAKGHGIYGCDSRCDSAPGGDGIVYYAGSAAESPTDGSGNWSRQYSYQLIAMDADGSRDGNQGLWYRRHDICDTCTFGVWGKLRGDNYGTNSANMPWSWDDPDDGQAFSGDLGCDPAMLFDVHLNGTPFDSNFSHVYVNHPYRSHEIVITRVRSDRNRDSFGGKSDILVKVTAEGAPSGSNDVLDARAWKHDNATVDAWYPFRYGADNAEGEKRFGDAITRHSFCRQAGAAVEVAVYDSDSPSADDYMGSIAITGSANYSQGIDLGDARIEFTLTTF